MRGSNTPLLCFSLPLGMVRLSPICEALSHDAELLGLGELSQEMPNAAALSWEKLQGDEGELKIATSESRSS